MTHGRSIMDHNGIMRVPPQPWHTTLIIVGVLYHEFKVWSPKFGPLMPCDPYHGVFTHFLQIPLGHPLLAQADFLASHPSIDLEGSTSTNKISVVRCWWLSPRSLTYRKDSYLGK